MKKMMGLSSLLFVTVSLASSPMLSVVPSVTSLTTRSDGETSVIYNVTNNKSTSITNLQVNPAYKTTGRAAGLSVQNDHCSGTTLVPNTTCQFGVVIQGASQPSSFTITPSVCGSGGQACSTTGSSGKLTVNVDSITSVPFAYFGTALIGAHNVNTPPIYAMLPINTSNNALGTPVTGLHFGTISSHLMSVTVLVSIAASLDGLHVYAAESPNSSTPDHTADIAVLSAGANSVLEQRIALPAMTDTSANFFVALTPDSTKLYVAVTGDSNQVYAINLNTDEVTLISGSFSTPSGIAISPDGTRAYILNSTGGGDTLGSISVINTTTNTVIDTISNASLSGDFFSTPTKVIISPDGTRLYVVNEENIIYLSITNTNGSYSYTYQSTIGDITDPAGLALSSDGDSLYVSRSSNPEIYKINTQNLSDITTFTGENSANTGIALTPDNNSLFITPNLSYHNPEVINNLLSTPTSATPIDISSVGNAVENYAAFVN